MELFTVHLGLRKAVFCGSSFMIYVYSPSKTMIFECQSISGSSRVEAQASALVSFVRCAGV